MMANKDWSLTKKSKLLIMNLKQFFSFNFLVSFCGEACFLGSSLGFGLQFRSWRRRAVSSSSNRINYTSKQQQQHWQRRRQPTDFVVTASRCGHCAVTVALGQGGGQRRGGSSDGGRKVGEGQEQLDSGAKTFHFSPFCHQLGRALPGRPGRTDRGLQRLGEDGTRWCPASSFFRQIPMILKSGFLWLTVF